MKKYIPKEILLFVFCFAITIYSSTPAMSSGQLPLVLTTINQTKVEMPDWKSISFSNFPKIESEGSINVDGDLRTWKRGSTPDMFLKLQDIAVLYPNLLNLSNIMEQTKINLLETSLAEFPLLGAQTVEYLVSIVPSLGKARVKDIAPIYALFKSVLNEDINKLENLVIKEVSSISPSLEALTLNEIDLSPYKIGDINNIEFVSLSQFKNWEKAYINQIPGLSKLPLSSYPVPILPQGNGIGTVKLVWKNADNVTNTISGSYKVGFREDCFSNCSNVELTNIQGFNTLKTAFWVNSKQLVEGGNGCLSKVNGAKEPTGRNPFGSLFKVVVDKIDDHSDLAFLALYFRFSNWCGSTPYVVGPIPYFVLRVDSAVFLGSDQTENFIFNTVELPTNEAGTKGIKDNKKLSVNSNFINRDVLADVIALNNNSDYNKYSDYLVAGDKKGRILGLYYFPSCSSSVMSAISLQPGGADWLKGLYEGKEINAIEMSKYFSPALQDNLFADYLSQLINTTQKELNPTSGKFFTEKSLISRVIEKVYFGSSSLVNSGDKEYIDNLVNNYYTTISKE